LIHDYRLFRRDVDTIRNELNDPETTTPANFPEVTADESIDVSREPSSTAPCPYYMQTA